MQHNHAGTSNTRQSPRAINEDSLYSGETTSSARTPAPRRTDDSEEQVEIWARRAANANGFGGM